MKKSLIALAVLAASGAAMAQSSVTLFGRLDVGMSNVKTETTGAAPVASLSQTKIDPSTYNTTFWGLKGTEDLGGGLKANFQLQSNFATDTGAVDAGGMFARFATVGFSGGFGSVNLGRQYTAYYSLYGATDQITDANVSTIGGVWGFGVAKTTVRVANSVRFDSANYGGVSGAISYGINEFAAGQDNNGSNVALHIKYVAGPLLVGFGHEESYGAYLGTAGKGATTKNDLLAGSYNFGPAKLTGGYNKASDGTRDDKEYQLGVDIPVSAAATLYAGYAHSNSTGNSTVAELNAKGYTFAAKYNLSKRTSAYVAYNNQEIEKGTIGAISTAKTTKFAAGVVHLF